MAQTQTADTNQTNRNSFTEGKILAPLVRFTLPLLAASLLQTAYGAVDLLVVGQFAQASDVSAVSTGSWLTNLFTMFSLGLSMGTTVLLGRRIGQKRPEEAGRVIGSSIAMFAALALILTLVIVSLAGPLSTLMQIPEASYHACTSYIRICGIGFVFIIAYNVLGSVFRGIGDSKIPFISVAISCAVNIAGDLLLVAVFHMGTAGAAIATVFAQAVSVVISLLIIRKRSMPFTFDKSMIRWDNHQIGMIVRLGIPIAASDVLVSISFLFITAIVNKMGVTASAGAGVSERLAGFIMLVPSSFSQGLAAFTAQNIGARKPERAHKAMLYAMVVSFCIDVVMFYLTFFHGELLSALFTRDPDVLAASADYLKAYSVDCLLTAFMFCFVGYYNGLGYTRFVMIQGMLSAFCVRIPVAYFMSKIVPPRLFYIGLSTPCATFVQLIMCLVFYFYIKKKPQKKEMN